MKLGNVIIYVENVVETLKFYENAFGFKQSFLHESNEYAEMATGETKLSFLSVRFAQSMGIAFAKNSLKNLAAGFEVTLITQDVAADFNHAVASGAIAIAAPALKPWGQTVAYVKDINGVFVEIASPMH